MASQGLGEALAERRSEGRAAVVPYLMVDRVRVRSTARLVGAMRSAGAAALELGFPFSDPIADGPVLQGAARRALENGTRWNDLLKSVRAARAELPVAVMTYANPVYSRGLANACRELRNAGASGLIVPDLSLEEAGPWEHAARACDLSLVLLAAPGASRERISRLARRTRGFLYLVSRYGTTGTEGEAASGDLGPLITKAHETRRSLAVLIGFGIDSPKSVRAALDTGADGVVVGSALEERLGSRATPSAAYAFIRPLSAVRSTVRAG